jgi:hypothetical protein
LAELRDGLSFDINVDASEQEQKNIISNHFEKNAHVSISDLAASYLLDQIGL